MKYEKVIAKIKKDIECYFSFLYEKGYRLDSVEYASNPNGSWNVTFVSGKANIYIVSDRGYISVTLLPQISLGKQKKISLQKIVHMLSNGKETIIPFTGNTFWGKRTQLKGLANILEKYIDQISSYLDAHFKEPDNI